MQALLFPALTCLSALPLVRYNLCPHPDAEITPSAGRWAAASQINIFVHWEAAVQIRETTVKICAADDAQGWSSSESPVEALVISTTHHHCSLSLLRSPIAIPFPLCFSLFHLPSSSISPIPIITCWILPPPVALCLSSTMAADEVLQMKPYMRSPNHSPSTATRSDMISSSILPIWKSRAKGL